MMLDPTRVARAWCSLTLSSLIVGTAMALILCSASLAQPPEVPKLTERSLDEASYVELARQWQQYIEENGETANALVNLGMAYNYSGEQEAAAEAARRAVELGPDDPKALTFLGNMLTTYVGDREAAIELLERSRRIAPDYGYGLTTLATAYLFQGDLTAAEEVFEVVFQRQILPGPLQDYAYNMLVGLPEGVVLITGGDSDTFGPLALQAGMDLRTDVIVLNRSLLNVAEYAQSVFERYPTIRPDYDIETHETTMKDGVLMSLSSALLRAMVAEEKVPVYFVASAIWENDPLQPKPPIEGINMRASGKGLTAEESANLFLDRYRLDSATDWGFAWSLVPSVSRLLSNYPASMIKLAEREGILETTKKRLLDRAAMIADFHDLTHMSYYIKAMQKQ
jgi:Tfp pilus assembly protein PilF